MPATPDPISLAFGEAIREARISRGVSQDELARVVQVQRTYVVDLEHGRRNPTLRNIARFAAALDLGTAELMVGVDRRLADRAAVPE